MATSSLGDVEPDVLSLESGEETGETVESQNFKTLKWARKHLGMKYIYFKERVWDNVVLVRVQKERGQLDYGTGFFFAGVGGEDMIMTNYHVVKNRRSGTKIQVYFDYYDGNDPEGYTCDKPLYCSHDGADGVDEDHRDFAVLPVSTQGRVRRNPMTLQRSDLANLSFQQGMRGIIVGHPQGGYKRLSIVDLHPDGSNTERRYSLGGTRPGSSGSPVLNLKNPDTPVALHYGVRHQKHCDTCTCADGVGVGVNILSVIDFISRSQLAERKLHYKAAKIVQPTKEKN